MLPSRAVVPRRDIYCRFCRSIKIENPGRWESRLRTLCKRWGQCLTTANDTRDFWEWHMIAMLDQRP